MSVAAKKPTAAAAAALVKRLGTLLPGVSLEDRQELVAGARVVQTTRREVIAFDEDVVLVTAGSLAVEAIGDGDVLTLAPGSAVPGRPPRGTTYRATARTTLMVLAPDALSDALRTATPVVHERLTTDANRVDLAGHLIAAFGAVAGPAIPAVLDHVTWRTVDAGALLFDRGDDGDEAYIVLAGRLVAEIAPGVTSDHTPGSLVGDLALLTGEPRAAAVRAARDTAVAVIDRAAFASLSLSHPELVLAISRALLRRVRRHSIATTSTVITVRAGHTGVDTGTLAARLRAALEPFGSVTVCDRQRAQHVLGTLPEAEGNGYDDHRLRTWLDHLQRTHRFVILGSSTPGDAWDARTTRSADTVLTAVHQETAPEQAPTIAQAHDLVVLHGRSATGWPDTAGWVSRLTPRRVHHVREDRADDLARMARFVSGRAVGLVFGGGGARGFAQIGVYRALHELGVQIDIVGGTSIGGVMATGPAMEYTPAQFEDHAEKGFHKLLDYTLPVVSLLRAERLTASMRGTFTDRVITDLWRPYFCVSTSITTSTSVIHDRGPIVPALRATVSIPGVMPPVPFDEELLIDGGILDNLPLSPMRQRIPEGIVIAVDVAPPFGPSAKEDYGLAISGSRVLRSRMGRGAGIKAPSFASTLMRSTLIAASARRDRERDAGLADLHLDLDVRGAGLLDFERVREITQKGYELSAPRIAAWLEAGGLDDRTS